MNHSHTEAILSKTTKVLFFCGASGTVSLVQYHISLVRDFKYKPSSFHISSSIITRQAHEIWVCSPSFLRTVLTSILSQNYAGRNLSKLNKWFFSQSKPHTYQEKCHLIRLNWKQPYFLSLPSQYLGCHIIISHILGFHISQCICCLPDLHFTSIQVSNLVSATVTMCHGGMVVSICTYGFDNLSKIGIPF